MIQKLREIILDEAIPSKHDYEYVEFTDAKLLYYPITTDRASKGEVSIKEGDYVSIGQVIGQRDGGFFKQNIHATVSGKYIGNEKKFFKHGKKVDCIVIENDFKEVYCDTVTDLSKEEIDKFSKQDIIDAVERNSIVGLGGSAFPTSIKLAIDKDIHTVILNGVECEPYLVSDYYAIVKHSKEIILGLELIMKVYGATKGYVAIKSKNIELYDCLVKELNEIGNSNIEIKKVGNYYPQGYEKDVIKSTLGLSIPVTVMPAEHGIMVLNSTSSKAIYDAVKYNLPVLERDFLVTGQAINEPKTFLVKVGTHVPDIIEKCGGYKDEYPEKVLVVGGPMMGSSVALDDVVVSSAVTSILVLPKVDDKEEPCVRCGSCVYSCPSKLSPISIANAVKGKNNEAVAKLNLQDCILCGMCSYVCTSKIPLTDLMAKGKKLL
ncbi:MAG: RnfABCDGE type electron transport complex subunit C [Bacilli bacterium]